MCKGKTIAVLVGVSLLLSSVIASAQPCSPRLRGMGMGPQLLEKLELTEKQRDQVKVLFTGLEKKRIDLRADLQHKKLELREAMDESKVDEGKVKRLVKEMGATKTELQMTRIDQQLGLKKILTPEQQKQLRQHRMTGGMMGGGMGGMQEGMCRCGKKSCRHGAPCPKGQ